MNRRPPPANPTNPVVVVRSTWLALDAIRQQAVRRLYEDLFPPPQRYDIARFGEEGATTWLALDARDIVVGFANTMDLPRSGAVLLRYMGVDSRLQSSGIGTVLLKHLARGSEQRRSSSILVEVEYRPGRPMKSLDQRRLRFYQRWGATPIPCLSDYYIADCSQWGHRLPMLLLWRPVVNAIEPRGKDLSEILADIVEREYAMYADPDFLSDLRSFVIC